MGVVQRQSIKSAFVSYVGIAIGAITTLYLLPKFLTAEEIGLIKVIVDLTSLIAPFMLFGTAFVITRYYHDFRDSNTDGGLVLTNLMVYVVFTVITASAYFLMRDVIANAFIERSALFVSFLYVPLYCAVLLAFFTFLRSISVVYLRTTVPTFLSTTVNRFGVALLMLLNGLMPFLDLRGFIYFYTNLFYLVPLLVLLVYIFGLVQDELKIPTRRESWMMIRRTIRYNLIMITSGISALIIQVTDSLMISSKIGLESTGIYSISFYMAAVVSIPRRTIAEISFPVIRKAIKDDNWSSVASIYRKSSLHQLLSGVFIFSLIWLNADYIFEVMPKGEVFARGKLVILFIGIGLLFDMITGVNRQIIEASSYYAFNFGINVLLSIMAVGLNLVFIPMYNIVGAAVASMISLLVANLLALVLVQWKLRMLPFSNATFKILLMFGAVMLLDIFRIDLGHPIVNIFGYSLFICLFFGITTYRLQLSPDFNNLADRYLSLVKR